MRPTGRAFAAIAVVVAGLVAGGQATAATAASKSVKHRTITFSGGFKFHLAPPPCAAQICVQGVFAGAHGGPFDEVITSSMPAGDARPGVVFGFGNFVIHTRDGNLTCDESFVFNLAPAGDKQGGVICTITGGTRNLAGATGYLALYGSQPAGSAPGSKGSGRYTVKLTVP